MRSDIDAVQSFGHPAENELLVLRDGRFSRELPIRPDYSGQHVDSLIDDKVLVEWKHHGATEDAVYLETGDNNE